MSTHKPSIDFTIPLLRLKPDVPYLYQYDLPHTYLVDLGLTNATPQHLQVEVLLTKKVGLCQLKLCLTGAIVSDCERCMNTITLPILDELHLILKSVSEPEAYNESEGDPDIYYIHFNQDLIDLTPWVSDLIWLGIPDIKKCAEEGKGSACNKEVLKRFL